MRSAASSRSFGLLIAGILFVVAALVHWAGARGAVGWGVAGAGFLVIALAMPRVLAPLKRLWLRIGGLLHVVIAPLVLGATFVIAIIPVGLLTRMFGKDLLSERWDASASSYWRKRPAGGPTSESLRDQF